MPTPKVCLSEAKRLRARGDQVSGQLAAKSHKEKVPVPLRLLSPQRVWRRSTDLTAGATGPSIRVCSPNFVSWPPQRDKKGLKNGGR